VRVERANSKTPNSVSNALMARLTAPWVCGVSNLTASMRAVEQIIYLCGRGVRQ
jgi:hypothetical protein